jgi:crotonobetainyl-CoA:carnitine CoA-transferase CaiB-like acyl-CoA transferase
MKWLARMPSDEASVEALRAARASVAPCAVAEAMAHPHLRERRTVRKVHVGCSAS